MPDTNSAELSLLVSHEQLENAFWNAIRMFVGRGKRHSAESVATGSGVHRRTLDCYRGYPIGHPDWRPLDYEQKFSLASYIGADLMSAWIQFMGQGAFDLPDVTTDPGELAAEAAEDSAKIVRMALNGKFDESEKPACGEVGNRMIQHGVALVKESARRVRA